MSFFSCDSPSQTGKSNTWFTPKWILEALGEFDLDPCSQSFRPFDTARKHIEHDQGGGTAFLKSGPGAYGLILRMEKIHEHGLQNLKDMETGLLLYSRLLKQPGGRNMLKRLTEFS